MNSQLPSTVVLAQPAAGRPAGEKAAKNIDSAFEELIASYRQLVRKRAIPYPAAYRFIRELGHGRQGVVFLATRQGARGCETRHAIKLFDPGIYSGAPVYWTDMGRIAQQIAILQPINNINLAAGDFYEECDGIGYMHMPAIDGLDLQFFIDGRYLNLARKRSTAAEWDHFTKIIFRLENGRLSLQPGMTYHLLRDILRGLSALHEHSFVHGDIKPTNIMINRQGTVKLIDFGRAVRLGEKVNILLGSPLYMAPEVHRREPACLQADLFSAGLVGLEMLVGNQISKLNDYNESQLMDFKTRLARQIESRLPAAVLANPEFTAVLKKMLEPDLTKRFASVKESESDEHNFEAVHDWLLDYERETDYERELEAFLLKLLDEDTGKLNPHFGADNLTAVIIT